MFHLPRAIDDRMPLRFGESAGEIKRRLPEGGRLSRLVRSLERNRITARHSIKTRRTGSDKPLKVTRYRRPTTSRRKTLSLSLSLARWSAAARVLTRQDSRAFLPPVGRPRVLGSSLSRGWWRRSTHAQAEPTQATALNMHLASFGDAGHYSIRPVCRVDSSPSKQGCPPPRLPFDRARRCPFFEREAEGGRKKREREKSVRLSLSGRSEPRRNEAEFGI